MILADDVHGRGRVSGCGYADHCHDGDCDYGYADCRHGGDCDYGCVDCRHDDCAHDHVSDCDYARVDYHHEHARRHAVHYHAEDGRDDYRDENVS